MNRMKVLLVLALGLLAACESAGERPRYYNPGSTRQSQSASQVAETYAFVDNSSRGLDNGGTGDPVANALAGAFYNEGGNGDVRARTENFFGDSSKDHSLTGAGKQSRTEAPAPTAQDRMLVYQGEMRVEVARPEDAARDFLAKVKEWGGYLQRQTGTSLVVRLPAPHFDDAFATARALGRVLGESRQANDVTEEFVDLGIRLDTAKKSRDRLLEVLQKAEKVEDILKVEVELRRLTEEIERMEGRRKFLADQVALATLTVAFTATASAPPPPPKSRQASRFDWINRVGAFSMMGDF